MMGNYSRQVNEKDKLYLPPGFRFHPTDEELITHYLCKKVSDQNFAAIAICDVDMNKIEPWELPFKAKMGEKEWYFFCLRDKKYPTGLRTNRATAQGYWKATGKDKEIYKEKILIGMKKTLVFYRGRAPKGMKTNWVSHEYRLEGKSSLHNSIKAAKNEWVICRVFNKTAGGKKVHISGIEQSSSLAKENQMVSSSSNHHHHVLPPLMDSSSTAAYSNGGGTTTANNSTSIIMPESGSHHVPCFSNTQQQQQMFNPFFNNSGYMSHEDIFQRGNHNFTNSLAWGQQTAAAAAQIQENNYQFSGSYPIQDNGILRALLENCGGQKQSGFKTEERFSGGSQETGLSTDINTTTEISSVHLDNIGGKKSAGDQVAPTTSLGPQDLDSIWNY